MIGVAKNGGGDCNGAGGGSAAVAGGSAAVALRGRGLVGGGGSEGVFEADAKVTVRVFI